MTIFFRKSIYYFQISDGVCNACNGYYGPAHGQSVCPTCHAFLYANDLDLEVNVELASVERDGEDSDSGMNKKKFREISNNIRRMLPFDIFFSQKQPTPNILAGECNSDVETYRNNHNNLTRVT